MLPGQTAEAVDGVTSPPALANAAATAALTVVHRDEDFIAVDKPSDMVCYHWSAGNTPGLTPGREETCVAAARRLPEFAAGSTVHLVHRLDRPTSGLLLLARSSAAAAELSDCLSSGTKGYLVLCRGTTPECFTVDRALRQRESAVNDKSDRRARQRRQQLQDARSKQEALTAFRRLATCCDGRCSLLLALPATGRFHQIRRHLDGLKHQVSGDVEYGPSGINHLLSSEYGLARLFLHAAVLLLPWRGAELKITCALPADLSAPLLSMPGGAQAIVAAEEALANLDSGSAAATRRAAARTVLSHSWREAIPRKGAQATACDLTNAADAGEGAGAGAGEGTGEGEAAGEGEGEASGEGSGAAALVASRSSAASELLRYQADGATETVPDATTVALGPPCKHFLKGHCRRGVSCAFAHDAQLLAALGPTAPAPSRRSRRSRWAADQLADGSPEPGMALRQAGATVRSSTLAGTDMGSPTPLCACPLRSPLDGEKPSCGVHP